MKKYKIAYVVSDLKRVGPSNQTLNIINNSPVKDQCIVITLFKEPKDTMINEYKDKNIKVISLNLGRISFIINGVNRLQKILKLHNIELVHSYGIKPDNICHKTCNKLNIPHIITLRNYPKEDILTRMNYIKGRIALYNHLKILKKAKNIVACSKTIQAKMKKDYPNMNIIAIQNGVDISKYKQVNNIEKNKIRKKLDLPLNKTIFISTSSFIKRKRITESLDGFLEYNNSNSIFILLGTGNEYEKIKKQYITQENIKFIGKCNNVSEYLNASDYFISSSESEGLPNGVIEAIACGIPVILSNIPQHTEVMEEINQYGFTYQLGDIHDLSIKMNKISKTKFINNDLLNSNLTMQKMSKQYFEYYSKLIKFSK